MNRLQRLNAAMVKKSVPSFEIGDTVRVHVRVVEGEKERVQVYEGVVISRKGGQSAETFTVRKVSYGVGVERIFPVHSPVVERVDVVRQGRVRRAKLFYLRSKKGKTARVAEREYLAEGKSKPEAAPATAEPEPVKAGA
jgi:large subunit ribosomal protein L19